MSLDWYLDEIENYKELCWIEDENDKESFRLNPVTNSLIWAMLRIGISKITESSIDEFFIRMRMVEQTGGEFMVAPDEDGKFGPYSITYDELRQHIGLTTNVSRFTDAQFNKKTIEELRRHAEYQLENAKKKEAA